jgi:hypothetical protein
MAVEIETSTFVRGPEKWNDMDHVRALHAAANKLLALAEQIASFDEDDGTLEYTADGYWQVTIGDSWSESETIPEAIDIARSTHEARNEVRSCILLGAHPSANKLALSGFTLDGLKIVGDLYNRTKYEKEE